jgi:hypothetical protein
METTQGPGRRAVLDVTELTSLRKRFGHAATALQIIGFLSPHDRWEGPFVACNTLAQTGSWRAIPIARHDRRP